MFYLSMFKFIPQNSIDFPPKSVQECDDVFNIYIIFYLQFSQNQLMNAIDVLNVLPHRV